MVTAIDQSINDERMNCNRKATANDIILDLRIESCFALKWNRNRQKNEAEFSPVFQRCDWLAAWLLAMGGYRLRCDDLEPLFTSIIGCLFGT